MPYRLDIAQPPDDALDRLVDLGALDVEHVPGGLAAILPDQTGPERVSEALGGAVVTATPAVGRDEQSVWVLTPRAVDVGGLVVAPAGALAPVGALQLLEADAFGTGLHPTTRLCLELLVRELAGEAQASEGAGVVLDVGTGSGILALAALRLGVPRAIGLDLDARALAAADANARLNGLRDRLWLVRGDIEAVRGRWPLVLANVLAAPLIEMAPALGRCAR
ncbi:MAG: methyltransferase domain-containing protein, partial [Acidobacteria bacterium]|nr:methyltransferase domain-containing protein [Acidobacteriota bacterium]